MKISEITPQDVVSFLRLETGDYNEGEIPLIMAAASGYITGYTGLTAEEMDSYDDLSIAFLALCQDIHDNRTLYPDKSTTNRTVETILGMYSRNLV